MKYRRRVPASLIPFINKKEIVKIVQSKYDAQVIDTQLDSALSIYKSNLSDTVKESLIRNELSTFISTKSNDGIVRYWDAVKLYFDSADVTDRELKGRKYFFKTLFPCLLKHIVSENPDVSGITSKHLNKIATIMYKLPSRNHGEFKKIDSCTVIQNIMNGVKYERILHVDTVNKHIKRVRSLALFGRRTGLYTMSSSISTIKHVYNAREQRMALTPDEIEVLLDATDNEDVKHFINLIRYTGLRTAEIGKYELTFIDGIECLDLRSAERLKTMSSYRIIPKHSQLQLREFTFCVEHLSRLVKRLIDDNLEDTSRKTLYSLRHSFASELILKGVRSDIVSELLGHQHKGMTLSRYAKGFSSRQLMGAIEQL